MENHVVLRILKRNFLQQLLYVSYTVISIFDSHRTTDGYWLIGMLLAFSKCHHTICHNK